VTERVPEAEAIADIHDARQYSERMSNRFVMHEYRQLAREVVVHLPDGGVIIDVGTGPGYVAIEVARLVAGRGCRVIGVDLSRAMLTVAAENAERQGLADTITWRHADAKSLPFESDSIDCIVSSGSLHHWADPGRAFDEMARVLTPNGTCVVRDSKRLRRPLSRLFAWLIGMTIPADFRRHYWNSIRSSYTSEELSSILARTRLSGYNITEDMMDLIVIGKG